VPFASAIGGVPVPFAQCNRRGPGAFAYSVTSRSSMRRSDTKPPVGW
jgi:hypothetical protein